MTGRATIEELRGVVDAFWVEDGDGHYGDLGLGFHAHTFREGSAWIAQLRHLAPTLVASGEAFRERTAVKAMMRNCATLVPNQIRAESYRVKDSPAIIAPDLERAMSAGAKGSTPRENAWGAAWSDVIADLCAEASRLFGVKVAPWGDGYRVSAPLREPVTVDPGAIAEWMQERVDSIARQLDGKAWRRDG